MSKKLTRRKFVKITGSAAAAAGLTTGFLHTGVFNVADMAITFGVLWLLATWAFARKAM